MSSTSPNTACKQRKIAHVRQCMCAPPTWLKCAPEINLLETSEASGGKTVVSVLEGFSTLVIG